MRACRPCSQAASQPVCHRVARDADSATPITGRGDRRTAGRRTGPSGACLELVWDSQLEIVIGEMGGSSALCRPFSVHFPLDSSQTVINSPSRFITPSFVDYPIFQPSPEPSAMCSPPHPPLPTSSTFPIPLLPAPSPFPHRPLSRPLIALGRPGAGAGAVMDALQPDGDVYGLPADGVAAMT